ncbi:receptor binding tail protein [Lactococcus phage CHPC781]|uniref:Receptor binding protein n=1 Tax=Lactococcus phage CHPC781 TaxID=2675252 RepID=A0A650ETS4_9CAUD|nr:receptor binding tail protein [Lactococcus phage CHPC781]QGT53082.1 baseplate protein [Lactococcus phage CHPC781]
MTIKNFTFFSPNGTEFPVGSNNDGKLYMMLTGMDYGTIRRKDWSSPLNTALNIQYVNTSIIAGGRYFELLNETVALKANSVNYIHANIDLTQTANPVSLSAETANNSNRVDINNGSGVLKVCFDIVTTSGTGVTSTKPIVQTSALDSISANDMTVSGSINVPVLVVCQIYKKGGICLGHG